MEQDTFDIIKSSGEKAKFSLDKLKASLNQIGADKQTVNQIIDKVRDEIYQGISTKEIYNRAYALLKKNKRHLASRYKLKKAIYELGPTGFPFEQFLARLFEFGEAFTQIGAQFVGAFMLGNKADIFF